MSLVLVKTSEFQPTVLPSGERLDNVSEAVTHIIQIKIKPKALYHTHEDFLFW